MDKDIMKEMQPVPHIVMEAAQIRAENRERVLHTTIWILIGIIIVLFVTSSVLLYVVHSADMKQIEANNQSWIDYIKEYDFSDYEYSQDGQGVNIIGDRNGVDFYGPEIESEDPDSSEPQ